MPIFRSNLRRIVVLSALLAFVPVLAFVWPVAARQLLAQVTWANPIYVFTGATYSAESAVAARPQNNAAYVGWEEKNTSTQHDWLYATSNDGPDTPFHSVQTLDSRGYQLIGNTVAAHDSLGRIHLAWFSVTDRVVIMYARSNPAGTAWEVVTPINITASSVNNPRKNVAIAIGPNNRVHLIWGREEQDVYYTYTDDGVNWAPGVALPWTLQPRDLTIAVSSANTVMAAWIDRGANSNGDVYATTMAPGGGWSPASNISGHVGNGTSHTYWPRLAADNSGGIRAVWADEDIRKRTDTARGTTDIWYREWTPAGWSSSLIQVVSNAGESQQPAIRVDGLNQAHIVWMDDTSRQYHNYTLRYSSGSAATGFSANSKVVPQYGDSAQAKDPALDFANNVLHLSFSSNISDPQRDNYYTFGITAAPIPTNTPPPTATLAPCTFYDVASADYYYQPVRYLCSKGAISGYSDGTFRPGNSATRGQLAKIVVVAEGWAINTSGGPHFSDVPTTNPFYSFIETAYHRNIISGYSCGGSCLEFRWGSNITRGQLSKIIVLAEGWATDTFGSPHFSDVLPNNPFFNFIETAYHHAVISGYSDGTFRWGNIATRGQIAKIVYLSVTN